MNTDKVRPFYLPVLFTHNSLLWPKALHHTAPTSGSMPPFETVCAWCHHLSQPLTWGKWLWWKATQKPSSIYTLCFLTVQQCYNVFALFSASLNNSAFLCNRREMDTKFLVVTDV